MSKADTTTVYHPTLVGVTREVEDVEAWTDQGWRKTPPSPEDVLTDSDGETLRGAALDQALEDAGLSKAGTVDEKRARLAEHYAQD